MNPLTCSKNWKEH